ncbi:helix-turn-helix transcriptional regulator [Nocardia sp. NPDC051052]|uniref:helix-turn-helix transcriptional regulator n=1 Tax=Nocardia sp. NPDC051052 TaxID=3364322 RepID=UPI0037A20A10
MIDNPGSPMDAVDQIGALADPLRRRLYEFVRNYGVPVSRDQVGEATGIARATAAYHLDKLIEHGLLAADYARPAGRGGPGAGRPAKLYRRAEQEVTASVPLRDYELLARLLADAVSSEPDGAVGAALASAAREAGRTAAQEAESGGGDTAEQLLAALRSCGYQPHRDGARIELRNCPFHRLACRHRDLVCGLNLSLITGMIDAAHDPSMAHLAPRPGHCCVVIDRPES